MVFPLMKALLVQLLVFHVQAARIVSRVGEDVALGIGRAANDPTLPELLTEQRGEVCGGRDIQSLLGADDSKGIRTTQWVKVDEVANNYITRQDASLVKLTEEIEELMRKIAEIEANERIKPLSTDSIKKLIEITAGSSETFGSLESARKSECGYVSMRLSRKFSPPVQRNAFQNTVSKFTAAVQEALQSKTVSTTAKDVLEVCHQEGVLKSAAEEESMTYCDELCTEIASAAQIASDEAVGVAVGESSASLREQVEAKKFIYDSTLEKRNTCSEMRTLLSKFRATVKPMEDDIKDAVVKVQRARAALDEAEEHMFELDDTIEQHQEAVKGLQTEKQEKDDALGDCEYKLTAAIAAESDMQDELKKLAENLAKAKATLRDAEDADHAAQQLKVYVSMVMLRMDTFFDFAVREPLRNLHLDEVDIDEQFQNPPDGDDALARFRTSVKTLDQFCKGTAMPAFASFDMTEKLSPLCSFGEEEEIVSGISKAVQTRTESVKEHISEPVGWLDRFHKQKGMTDEIAEQYVAEGEPEGLRDVIGPFKLHGYFMDWRRGGPFLALLEQMHVFIVNIAAEGEELDGHLTDVSAKLDQLKKNTEAAKEALKTAKLNHQLVENELRAVEDLLASVEKEAEKQSNLLDELEAALREAKKRWKEAQSALEAAFKTGTGLAML